MPDVLHAADPAAPARMWEGLVDAAISVSRCAGSGAECRIETVIHRAGWAVVSHISVEPHLCLTCEPRATPEHLISLATLVGTERRLLVGTLVAFLDHLHLDPASFIAPPLDSATGADLRGAGPSSTDGA